MTWSLYSDIQLISQPIGGIFARAANPISQSTQALQVGSCTDCHLRTMYAGTCGVFQQKSSCWTDIHPTGLPPWVTLQGDICCAENPDACCETNVVATTSISFVVLILTAALIAASAVFLARSSCFSSKNASRQASWSLPRFAPTTTSQLKTTLMAQP